MWKEILLYIIEGLLSIILTAISAYLIPFLIKKYANDKDKKMLLELNTIISNCVKNIYQTFVEAIKGTDEWTKEAQEEALQKCYKLIEQNLSSELKSWLKQYTKDVELYIKGLIESTIYSLKVNSKAPKKLSV